MEIAYIYTLSDPITKHIKYVGKTIHLNRRLNQHLNSLNGNTYKQNWIKKLKKQNLIPEFNILDEVLESEWKFWEIYWINQIRCWGFKLTNEGIGGEGGNCTKEVKEKIRKKLLGNKYRLGTKHTPQQLINISNSLKGHKQKQETIDRRAKSNFKKVDLTFILNKYNEGLNYKQIGELLNLSHSKIYKTLKNNNLIKNKRS